MSLRIEDERRGDRAVLLDANGFARLSAEELGTLDLKAIATDKAGNRGEATLSVEVFDPSDTNPPVVSLDPTVWETPITHFTDVLGTAHDPDGTLDYYSLEVAPAAGGEFVEFLRVEDTDIEANSTLGEFDPTTLLNDSYRLRLTAADTAGNLSSVEEIVDVAGELKLGNFQLSFTDMEIPVSGIPISVTRTYDSLTSNWSDELGYGWRLEFRDTDLRTSLPKPTPEQELLGQLPGFKDGDRVYVTVPGGKRVGFTFEPRLDPISRFLQAPGANAGLYQPEFVADDGVFASLRPKNGGAWRSANSTLAYSNGQYVQLGTGRPYNPADPVFGGSYILTTKDGIEYEIDGATGDLVAATDLNGNELTFTDDGIFSDTGVAVTFARDAKGRITEITDPDGEVVSYEYDAAGDLVAVTDREEITTQFGYGVDERPHYLDEIIDPLGRPAVRTEYDEKGRLKRTLDVNGEAVEIDYDPENSLQTVEDVFGNPTTYVYDDRGNVVTEIDALGKKTERTYDEDNNVLTETLVTVEDGVEQRRTTTWTYDSNGNKLTETDSLDRVTRSTYDDNNRLLTETDPAGNTTTYDYDDRGNLRSTKDAEGNVTQFEYDNRGQLRFLTDADGNPTEFEYDPKGNVRQVTDALDGETVYRYNPSGLRTEETQTVTTPDGVEAVVTEWHYDAEGRLDYHLDAEDQRTDYQYDDNGNQIAVTDPRGTTTHSVYDAKNQLVETIYPDDTPDTLEDNPRSITLYDKGGRRRASIDEAGRVTHFRYNAVGQLIETIAPNADDNGLTPFFEALGLTGTTVADVDWTQVVYPDETPSYLDDSRYPRTTTEYYATGEVKANIDERGNRTEYRYDALGRRIETIYPDKTPDTLDDNPRETVTYDQAGRQETVTDALNRTTTYRYDDLGRLVETIYADETSTETEYDKLGRRVASIDPLDRRTEYEYDKLGRLTDVVGFLEGREIRTEYGYDELGRQIWQEDANDHRTTFKYDLVGRRTGVELPEGQTSTSTYDKNGNLLSYTDFNRETTSYSYNPRNWLTDIDLPNDPDVSYTYTPTGLQETVTDSRGTTSFAYDHNNRLVGRTDPDGVYTADGFSIEYEYDIAGNRTQVETPGGVTDYRFDERNRLETVSDSSQGTTTYQYDAVNNLVETVLPNGVVETRQYDESNRLEGLEQTRNGEVVASYDYELDDAGNRISVTENDTRTVEYEYDDLGRLTQERFDGRTVSYEYDDVGNRLKRVDSVEGETTYVYDDNDRLLESTANGVLTTYEYDDNGNLTSQTTNGKETTYTWDDRNRLVNVNTADGDTVVYEYDDENIRVSSTVNGTKTTYLVDSNRPYAQVLEEYEDENLKVRYVHGLDLISVERDGEVSVYLVDGLGSTRRLTDLNGEVVATYTYDAFGELLDSTGEVENDYLFAGEQFDGELEQYYLRQRFYDAGVGRFTRRDTYEGRIGEPITLHKYLYGNANPVNFVDPSGLSATSINAQLATVAVMGILVSAGNASHQIHRLTTTDDPPPPVPFPFPGEGSIPDEQETFPNNDGILDRILDFGRRTGGFGEGVEPEHEYRETFPNSDIYDLVQYVFNAAYENVHPDPKSLTTKVGNIANRTGLSNKEIKDAIHAVKEAGIVRAYGKKNNPDVGVDVKTGDVFIQLEKGIFSGDPIGNLGDHVDYPE
ncbi:RHS repeat-associated core domain-containing protein [Baaleninema simplex]|uniref:RHS repeat-associated core domain-containing protein n=1 Tax=Baaleninema simplex TaxID=2862350 RepID=UPI0003454057|nr:RHS repeat-associated core domain-containing protein [Baaleninema simplex]